MHTSATYQEVTQVTRKGQVTVPISIRKALGLKRGDRVAFALSPSGEPQATLTPVSSVAQATFGSLASETPMLSPQEERQAAAAGLAEAGAKKRDTSE